jgi:hypothetical protein
MNIGKFQKVALREIWKHEALDFTQWLAIDENLELLSDVIGVTLSDAQTEVSVGKFNVDILAEDENDKKVIIENQLEQTNHDHLGKIITYAAGLQAETIIWVVSNAREEHEQAINWLNENTTEDANFFLIVVEAWRIDNSAPAPRFNIIAKPNNWAKTVRQSGAGNKVTDTKLKQQAFWEKLRAYGEENAKNFRGWQKASPQHWINASIGKSGVHITATIDTRQSLVGVQVYISDNKELFYGLENKKQEIERSLGFPANWQGLPEKKASYVGINRSGDILDESQEQELVEWIHEKAEQFSKVFKKYLK